jgi:hypothetical protein
MIVLGLLLLVAAAVIAVDGVLTNLGHSHLLTRSLDIFGYHLTGSTGRLLLVGVILGAAGMLGLNLLLAGLGRGIKRRVSTRRQLKADDRQNKQLASERDQLSRELEDERARAADPNLGTGREGGGSGAGAVRGRP